MKRQLFFLLISTAALAFGSCMSPKRVTHLDMPEENPDSVMAPVDVDAYMAQYSDYDGVVLDHVESIEHSGFYRHGSFSDWIITWIATDRRIVFNPENQDLTMVELPDKPTKMYIRAIDPDGSVRTWGPDCLVADTNALTGIEYKFAIPNVHRGTIIERGHELMQHAGTDPPFLSLHVPVQLDAPCEHIQITFAYPDQWAVAVRRLGPHRELPYQSVLDANGSGKSIITYEATDVLPSVAEPYSPPSAKFGDYLDLRIAHSGMPTIDNHWLDNWPELARRYRSRFFASARDVHPKADSVTAAITGGIESSTSRIIRILDWVRSNIHAPMLYPAGGNVDHVIVRKVGNRYDMCELTRAMAVAAGLRAQVIQIHLAGSGYFDPTYLSDDQFPVPAVRVTTGDSSYVLFPYVPDLPYDIVTPDFAGQPALVISGNSIGAIVQTPDGSLAQSMLDESYDITIDSTGLMTVDETKSFVGQAAFLARNSLDAMFRQFARPEWPRFGLTFRRGDIIMIDSVEANANDFTRPLMFSLKYTVANLVTVTPDEVIMQTGGLFAPVSYREADLDVAERRNPVQIYSNEVFRKRITIHYPENWTVISELPATSITNTCGTAEQSASSDPGMIDIWQQVTLTHGSRPKDAIADLAALIGTRSVVEQPTLVFSVNSKGN